LRLVMNIFSTSWHFGNPTLDCANWISVFTGLCSSFLSSLVRTKFVAEDKLDDLSLPLLHQNEKLMSPRILATVNSSSWEAQKT
jgi:hypothetical protein